MSESTLDLASSKSWLVRNGYSASDALAAIVGLLLTIAYATFFFLPSWTPRMAVLVMTVPFTSVLLIRQAVRREPIALAAAGVVFTALLSAGFSGNFRLSVIGVVASETGVLIFLGSLGLLALGTQLSERGQRALVWAVIGGIALSGAVGLLQMLVQAESGPFIVQGGRASGLTPSSVYFGACAAGAFGVVVGRVSDNRRTIPVDVALAVWFGLSIGLSGTRVALGGAAVAGMFAIAVRRGTRPVVTTVGLAAGIVLGQFVASTVSPDVGATDRLVLNGGGRTEVWRYAFDSFLDRPLLGYGPGGFREAIQDDVTVSFSANMQDNIEAVWFNAHNYVFHTAATMGAAGLLAILAMSVLLIRSARGPLAYGGLALVLSWTLQPFSLSTMPLALLLLGGASAPACAGLRTRRASSRAVGPDDVSEATSVAHAEATPVARAEAVPPTRDRSPSPYLLLPGIAVGCFLLAFDLSVQRAVDADDPDAAAAWVERMPPDPFLADFVAQFYAAQSLDNAAFTETAINWGDRAIAEQPNRALWRVRTATRYAQMGNLEAALAQLEVAREHEPNSWKAVEGQFYLLQALGRDSEAEALLPLVCDLQIIECSTAVDSASD